MILKSINEGLKFALSLNVIVPYLVLYLISIYALVNLFSEFTSIASASMNVLQTLISLGIYLPVFMIIGLANLLVNGAVIDQAKYYPKKRVLTKSLSYSASRYLSMLFALILYTVISGLFSYLPYIGSILSIALSLLLFYLYQAIIVDKKGCMPAFRKSFNIFIRYPLETFATWLLMSVIGFIIVGFFALPMIVFALRGLPDITQLPTGDTEAMTGIIRDAFLKMSNAIHSPYFVVYILILCIGLSISSAFQKGVQTRLYLNTRRVEV